VATLKEQTESCVALARTLMREEHVLGVSFGLRDGDDNVEVHGFYCHDCEEPHVEVVGTRRTMEKVEE
jgi:hypothetical protein